MITNQRKIIKSLYHIRQIIPYGTIVYPFSISNIMTILKYYSNEMQKLLLQQLRWKELKYTIHI